MKHTLTLLAALLLALPTGLYAAEPSAPAQRFQYQSGNIAIPAATADEPKVAAFGAESILAAAKYLDDGAVSWTREKSCIACHTTGVYLAERPALTKLLGKPREEVRAAFVADLPETLPGMPSAPGAKPLPKGEFAVWRALGLAQWDRHVAGALSEATDRSLRDMLARQGDHGFWRTVSKVEIPHTTTEFEITVQAARAIAAAPGWLEGLRDAEMLRRIALMKTALAAHQPRNDYERALQLQLATFLPELVPQSTRDAVIAMLWKLQQTDGGWSTRSMSAIENWGDKIRPDVVTMLQQEPDAANPASDVYMTAFAIVLLRENGVPGDDERIRRGIAWLKSNQRESGRWWMKSLYKDTKHYTTFIGTAQALRALALCGEVARFPQP
jgi:squalene-hopene/tetraprenyl-beta-curcumene cyclase